MDSVRAQPQQADAAFVTDQLLVGGDLDVLDLDRAVAQLAELVEFGVTHVVDVRVEWNDVELVREHAPGVAYLHHGMDDAGQRVPGAWFDRGVGWVLDAFADGGTAFIHCHMGINRGPSLGYAVLLAQGWDPVDALDAIRCVRPIAYIAYAEEALRWHHDRHRASPEQRAEDRARVRRWREDHHLDVARAIRLKRQAGY